MSQKSLVVLVQPEAFFANKETAKTNHFQDRSAVEAANAATPSDTPEKQLGIRELQAFHAQLAAHGITVCRIPLPASEGGDVKPDAIFPNNSFSLHAAQHRNADGTDTPVLHGIMWPMSPGRVDEIPLGIRSALAKSCKVVHDFRHLQGDMTSQAMSTPTDPLADDSVAADDDFRQPQALEGTGALVFSGSGDACFMARSGRGSEAVLRLVTALPGCVPFRRPNLRQIHVFDSKDRDGNEVYHTNVLGWCGTKIAAWCLESMTFTNEDEGEEAHDDNTSSFPAAPMFTSSKAAFRSYFARRNVQLLELSMDELYRFAGNCLELFDAAGRPVLTMSSSAWDALRPAHRAALSEVYGESHIVVAHVPTIERFGGGSVRCLQAHLNYGSDVEESVERLVAALHPFALPIPNDHEAKTAFGGKDAGWNTQKAEGVVSTDIAQIPTRVASM